jgi:hypothetical protein
MTTMEQEPYDELLALAFAADQVGVKLELASGVPFWEPHPSVRHQVELRRIMRSIEPRQERPEERQRCGCIELTDVYIRFPEGSLKRPDVAIFCRMPEATDKATTELPVAVIEIVSEGYEEKDQAGIDFYLAQGVLDVVTFDPRTLEVIHATPEGRRVLTSPSTLDLRCGCRCQV